MPSQPPPPQPPGDDPVRRQRPPGSGSYPPEYHQPPPYAGYAQTGYERPSKKKAKWPWIVLAAILLVILLVCGGCFLFMGGMSNEIDQEMKGEVTLTYEVTGDSPRVGNISYSAGGESNNIEASQQQLPWTEEVTVAGCGRRATRPGSDTSTAA
jgi:hypothetical protein